MPVLFSEMSALLLCRPRSPTTIRAVFVGFLPATKDQEIRKTTFLFLLLGSPFHERSRTSPPTQYDVRADGLCSLPVHRWSSSSSRRFSLGRFPGCVSHELLAPHVQQHFEVIHLDRTSRVRPTRDPKVPLCERNQIRRSRVIVGDEGYGLLCQRPDGRMIRRGAFVSQDLLVRGEIERAAQGR